MKSRLAVVEDWESLAREAGYEAGFKHPSHFIRWFRSRHGCTPMSVATNPPTNGHAMGVLATSAGPAARIEP